MSAEGPASGQYLPITEDAANDKDKATPNPLYNDARRNDSSSQQSREPIEDHPLRRKYWIASLVLTAITLLMSIGTIVTAAVDFHKSSNEQEAVNHILSLVLYILSMVEAALTFIAMLVLIPLLAVRPRSVLISDKCNGSFICLCIAIFFLFLCAVYSFVVPIVLKNHSPKMPPAVCVIPGVRFIALICFFAVLVANSKL